MKLKKQAERKARTRQLVQLGGLVQKSGIVDAFSILPGDDLQGYENFHKGTQLLGFLVESFEKMDLDETQFKDWQMAGERLLRR